MTDPTAVVRAYFAAITAHDVEAVQSCFADNGELVTATGTYQGPGAIGGFYRDNAFQLADLRPTPGSFIVDGNRVAVEIDLVIGGQHTAVADFFTIENDKIQRLVIYLAGPPLS